MSLANLFQGLSQGFNTYQSLAQALEEQKQQRLRQGLEDQDRRDRLNLEYQREASAESQRQVENRHYDQNASLQALKDAGIVGATPDMLEQARNSNQTQSGSGAGTGGANFVSNTLQALAQARQQPGSNPRADVTLPGGLIARSQEKPLQNVNMGDSLGSYDETTGTYTKGPALGISATEKAKIAESEANAAAAREMRQASLDTRKAGLVQTGAQNFMTNNKELYGRASTLNQALLTLHSTSPALYKSKLVNFLQAADPKAQIRLGTLQYFGNVDPSAAGNMNVITQKLENGQYPQYIVDGLVSHLESLRNLNKSEWAAKRDAYTKSNPGAEQFIPDAETAFGTGQDAGTPTTAGGKKYVLPDGTVVQ